VRINATSTAPVARVLASNANPTFPPHSRSAMIPDPTTVDTRSPVPTASEITRLASEIRGLNCELFSDALKRASFGSGSVIAQANIQNHGQNTS
jgi:hypothetical protein